MRCDGDRIPGGIFLMRKDGMDLGLVRVKQDPGEDGTGPMLEIGPLGIMPGHQGKGYGTLLLRHALRFGADEVGLPRALLSVNAENTPALGLSLREGFVVTEGLSCMRQDFSSWSVPLIGNNLDKRFSSEFYWRSNAMSMQMGKPLSGFPASFCQPQWLL